MVTPWLRRPEQDAFRELALAYLAHSG
jgi:hypothetical protein